MKNLLILIVLCLLGWGIVYKYREYKVDHGLASGDTISPDGSAPASDSVINSNTATSPVEQPQTVKQVVVPGSTSAQAASTTPSSQPVQATPVQGKTAQDPPAPSPESTSFKLPVSDTISANPPNGTVFSGTGRFQVYRQGNLTWRINTDTGQSCVLFATDAEWRKPRVYQRGCAQS
ncbi:hypothetical protein [Granulicella sibirica]|uniref:Uncharacterized protein n=1 Tax=Granulicella sibirica TaxID=2479048 RepID=A0A4Q0SZ48_9BACT|nr:hypothetical protein [Granulicella sibirica]RXH56127.1 hypothetical protein GRAN_2984 [Granulicella sibirica]